MQNKLFVRNLSFKTEDAELSALFEPFGRVISAKVAVDRDTGRGRGFGFVEMHDVKSAEEAISGLNSTEFNGREVFVAFSEPKTGRSTARNW